MSKKHEYLDSIKAVIFDMDGLMIDSERIFYQGYQAAAEQFGADDPLVLATISLGVRDDESAVLFSNMMGPDFDSIGLVRFVDQYVENYFHTHPSPIKAGLIELLNYLKQRRIRLGIATGSVMSRVEHHLASAGIGDYFDAIVSCDMVSQSKPAPEIFLRCAALLDCAPNDCLALEDSISGVTAAFYAGIKVIMVPDLVEPDDDVKQKVFAVANDLHDVLVLLQAHGM